MLFEKFKLAHQANQFLNTRENACKSALLTAYPSFKRKISSTMVFQPKITLGLIFLDHMNPVESDSESVTSTIPIKNRTKPSKIDRLGPFVDNAGFHLVTNSSTTQPKINQVIHAPPHPIRYPLDAIGLKQVDRSHARTHPTKKPSPTNITGRH